MGAAAARLADVVVVTDDNPRSEDPALIRAAVLAGARDARESQRAQPPEPAALKVATSEPVEIHEVADRRTAIERRTHAGPQPATWC